LTQLKIAVFGDIHGHFSTEDARWLNESDRDRVLFTGDLAGFRHADTLRIAGILGTVEKPAWLIPGNHDTVPLLPFLAELSGESLLTRLSRGQGRRATELAQALGPVQVGGFSRHSLDEGLDLIVGRPHPMGGSQFSFGRHLERAYGIADLDASASRLRALVDEAAPRILFLAHNGPTGLGERRADIFGCDFKPEEGDWGDSDLRAAVDHALGTGRSVPAVIAGHMHHALRGGGKRTWQTRGDDGVLYVNAARVPRVFGVGGRRSRQMRHHVLVTVEGGLAEAEEVLI